MDVNADHTDPVAEGAAAPTPEAFEVSPGDFWFAAVMLLAFLVTLSVGVLAF